MLVRVFTVWLAALAVLGTAVSARAQNAAESGDEVVVYGKPLEDIVREFVGELSGAPQADSQLARWDRSICPGIYGLKDRQTAERLIDRMAVRAFELELNVGEPGCSPDIVILFTDNVSVLTAGLRSRLERVLNERNVSTFGRRELAAFVNSDAPVRWWTFASTKSRLGLDIGPDLGVYDLSPSRVRPLTRQDMSKTLIVVNANLTRNLRVGTLGDYLAMVSLAQIDPEAETAGYSTILNLFAGGSTEMTAWDRSYLEGLYGATRAARSIRQQEAEIRRTIMNDLDETAADGP